MVRWNRDAPYGYDSRFERWRTLAVVGLVMAATRASATAAVTVLDIPKLFVQWKKYIDKSQSR
jgi:hypothetical protein